MTMSVRIFSHVVPTNRQSIMKHLIYEVIGHPNNTGTKEDYINLTKNILTPIVDSSWIVLWYLRGTCTTAKKKKIL